jgi:hypothetical protein
VTLWSPQSLSGVPQNRFHRSTAPVAAIWVLFVVLMAGAVLLLVRRGARVELPPAVLWVRTPIPAPPVEFRVYRSPKGDRLAHFHGTLGFSDTGAEIVGVWRHSRDIGGWLYEVDMNTAARGWVSIRSLSPLEEWSDEDEEWDD